MPRMAKKKNNVSSTTETPKRGRPAKDEHKPREGKSLHIWLKADIAADLDDFIEGHPLKPSYKSVIELALSQFFRSNKPPQGNP